MEKFKTLIESFELFEEQEKKTYTHAQQTQINLHY